MQSDKKRVGSITKVVAVAALALGLGAGGYGVAAAASGSGSGSSSSSTTTTDQSTAQTQPATRSGQPWGGQRSDETLLTGDTASKVEAAAVAEVGSGATVVRVETDADGHAAYEAHMTKADGTLVTVYVDRQFNVVSVENR